MTHVTGTDGNVVYGNFQKKRHGVLEIPVGVELLFADEMIAVARVRVGSLVTHVVVEAHD